MPIITFCMKNSFLQYSSHTAKSILFKTFVQKFPGNFVDFAISFQAVRCTIDKNDRIDQALQVISLVTFYCVDDTSIVYSGYLSVIEAFPLQNLLDIFDFLYLFLQYL